MGSDPKVDKDASADEQPQHRLYPAGVLHRQVSGDQRAIRGLREGDSPGCSSALEEGPDSCGQGKSPGCQCLLEGCGCVLPMVEPGVRQGSCGSPPKPSGRKPHAETMAGSIRGAIDPPTKELCNFGGNVGDTTPVGQYPAGASPCGALDMAGNVWEWTGSLYRPYPYQPEDGRNSPDGKGAARGAWRFLGRCSEARPLRLSVTGTYLTTSARHIGFRVVVSLSDSGF